MREGAGDGALLPRRLRAQPRAVRTRDRAARSRDPESAPCRWRAGILATSAHTAAHVVLPRRYRGRARRREGGARRGGRLLPEARPDRLPERGVARRPASTPRSPASTWASRRDRHPTWRACSPTRRYPRGLMGMRRLADRYAARAVRMADVEGQSEALAYVWNLRALLEAQRGHWRPGDRGQRPGAAAVRRDRRLQPRGRGLADAVGTAHLRGRLRRCRGVLDSHARAFGAQREPATGVLVVARRGADARRAGRDRGRRRARSRLRWRSRRPRATAAARSRSTTRPRPRGCSRAVATRRCSRPMR